MPGNSEKVDNLLEKPYVQSVIVNSNQRNTEAASLYNPTHGPDGVRYQVIFSTGCSTFQDWQSYVFFYHAWKSGQLGHVTRIASGCSNASAAVLEKFHRDVIETMQPGRFHLHITPDYSKIKPGVQFKYFNKPYGTRHWMEHVLGYPSDTSHDDDVVILLDPDQVIVRPFTNDFTNLTELWEPTNLGRFKVEHGSPFAQQYGFGSQWKTKVNMSHVSPNEPSFVDEITVKDAELYYSAGPPYLATGRDMYAIVSKWCDFVPRVHDNYPELLAEMFGYCVAAGHLKLPHQLAWGFMVSDTSGSTGEGWGLIDPYPNRDICGNIPKDRLPHVLHYCQRYFLGKWFIGKFRMPDDFLTCESDLLMEPPQNLPSLYYYGVSPQKELFIWRYPHMYKRHAFMVCTLIKALNDASQYYKEQNCPRATVNLVKKMVFHNDSMEVEPKWLQELEAKLKDKPLFFKWEP